MNGHETITINITFQLTDDLNAFITRVCDAMYVQEIKNSWSAAREKQGSVEDVMIGDMYVVGQEY
jgi:hypothetical protein